MKNLMNTALFFILTFSVFAQKDCSKVTYRFIPIPDMTGEKFRGFSGGLYGNGTNIKPKNHEIDIVSTINNINPLDKEGSISNNGRIIMIGVGASNPRTEFNEFVKNCNQANELNKYVSFVNTCIGGQGIQKMNDINDNYWKQAKKIISDSNYSEKQVQIAWIETDNTQNPDTSFPQAAVALMNEYQKLLATLKYHFPNLKICYVSARGYSGWVSGDMTVGRGLLHPRDYYNGWALRFLIDSVMTNKGRFTYSGKDAQIPLTTWGSYLWTNGSEKRSDGFTINCETDIGPDGLHLTSFGEQKMGKLIFDTFASDSLMRMWMFNNSMTSNAENFDNNSSDFDIIPNPIVDGKFTIYKPYSDDMQPYHICIISPIGEVLLTKKCYSYDEVIVPKDVIDNYTYAYIQFVSGDKRWFKKVMFQSK